MNFQFHISQLYDYCRYQNEIWWGQTYTYEDYFPWFILVYDRNFCPYFGLQISNFFLENRQTRLNEATQQTSEHFEKSFGGCKGLLQVSIACKYHEEILNTHDSLHRTPLFWASTRGHTKVLKVLLNHTQIKVNTKQIIAVCASPTKTNVSPNQTRIFLSNKVNFSVMKPHHQIYPRYPRKYSVYI